MSKRLCGFYLWASDAVPLGVCESVEHAVSVAYITMLEVV
jgi:hypothetical protein